MSQSHLGWVRSYRQALEMLIRFDADKVAGNDSAVTDAQTWALARLDFVANMYSLRGVDEVLEDIKTFREFVK